MTSQTARAWLETLSKYVGDIETRIGNHEEATREDLDGSFVSGQREVIHRWLLALEMADAALDQSYLIPVSEEYAKNGST